MSDELNEKLSVTEKEPEKNSLFSEETRKKKSKANATAKATNIAVAGASATKIIVLAVVLLVAIIALVLVIVLKPYEKEESPKFDVWEGEDTFGNAAHLAYPLIDEDTVTKMDIYLEGEKYSFIPSWDENLGKYDWRIAGLEKIDLDASTFEMLRMWLCTLTTKSPIRNATQDDLVAYEIDKENYNGFTVYYTENDIEKSHTVRIGKQTNLSTNEYYAYIEGRPHVYKISKDVVTYTSYSKLKYLSPVINTFFGSDSYTIMGIDKFDIYLTNGSNTNLKDVVSIRVNNRGETSVDFKAVYGLDEFGRQRTTIANTSYALSAFSTLYQAFSGTEVVCVGPTEEDLKNFGLDSETEKYFINVEFYEKAVFENSSYKNNEPSLYISREIDGCHYVLSQYYGQKLIVKVLKSSLSFLGEDSLSLLKWTDINSITTGFYEAITENDDGGIGLKEIIVQTPKNNETFILSYDKENDQLTVKCKNNKNLVFVDDNSKTGIERNTFRNLYVYMLYFPFINSFNSMSDADTMEYIKPENVVYSITAIRNDNTAARYTYYKMTASLAIECFEEGKVVNGNLSFGTPYYGNIGTVEEIRRVTNAIDKLLADEKLLPDEDILK